MKNYIISCMIGCALWSCTDHENITPAVETNPFELSHFSSEEEMTLRRNFHQTTGCYLTFNDSLGYIERESPAGTYKSCEIIDVNYQVTNYSNDKIIFNLLTDMQQKKQIVQVLTEEVLPKLPSILYPYAFFIVNELTVSRSLGWSHAPMETAGAYAACQATLVGNNGIAEMNGAERYRYVRQILRGILIGTCLKLDEKEYADFYQYSSAYYGSYHAYTKAVMELGFLDVYSTFYYYNKKEDLLGYILEIFSMTGQEFEEKYAEYPLVLQKQKALVKILEKNGVSVY